MSTMQMKYIFLRKNTTVEKDSEMSSHNTVAKMFRGLFNNVTNDSFDIEVEGHSYIIDYKLSSNNSGNTYYLALSVEGKISKCAKVLDEVNKKLLHGYHRKEYNITLTFDCISNYYCNKIYPKFNLFERKIRELIFFILIKSLGIDWYDTIPKELKDELKKKKLSKPSDFIEKALYEMTISQLETYLFDPVRFVEIDSVIDNQLDVLSVNNMTKEEIIEILDTCRAKSVWEKFFEGSVHIDNLQKNLSIIREYRNSVAHSKYFYKDDYIKCTRILNKLTKQIENAIEITESRTLGVNDISKSLGVLARTVSLLFAPAIKAMLDINISEQMRSALEASRIEFSKINTNISEQMKSALEASKIDIPRINTNISEQMRSALEASKIDFSKINTNISALLEAPKTAKIFEQIRLMSQASNMINNQMVMQMKVLSEASGIPVTEQFDVSETTRYRVVKPHYKKLRRKHKQQSE